MSLQHENKKTVLVHIDRHPYTIDQETTGEALYKAADIPLHRELFREVQGASEDVLVHKDHATIHLVENEHFYSQKEIAIVVNGRERVTVETKLSFAEIVKLAEETAPTGENISYVVKYRKGPAANPEGELESGQSVKIKKGMIFNVTTTDKS